MHNFIPKHPMISDARIYCNALQNRMLFCNISLWWVNRLNCIRHCDMCGKIPPTIKGKGKTNPFYFHQCQAAQGTKL